MNPSLNTRRSAIRFICSFIIRRTARRKWLLIQNYMNGKNDPKCFWISPRASQEIFASRYFEAVFNLKALLINVHTKKEATKPLFYGSP